ncbi:MAG: site-specific integrase [Deltaproteobacteria bacterium]|nr:site-specific integrase [Deltaproteobacteria bacterium]
MLRYAEETEVIVRAPRVKLIRAPQAEFDFLDFDEAERLLRTAATHEPEWYVMLLTALRTGLRFGELCELRWDDVDLVSGRLRVRRNFTYGAVTTPKNGRPREVPLSPQLIEALKRHRHLNSLVFCKADGGRRIHRRADVAIKRICRRAGLRKIGWHVLRHTMASHLVMRGRSLKEVQELLGHSDLTMTLRYAHLSPAAKQEAVATLDSPGLPGTVLNGRSSIETLQGHGTNTSQTVAAESGQRKSPVTTLRYRANLGRGGRDSNPRPPA